MITLPFTIGIIVLWLILGLTAGLIIIHKTNAFEESSPPNRFEVLFGVLLGGISFLAVIIVLLIEKIPKKFWLWWKKEPKIFKKSINKK